MNHLNAQARMYEVLKRAFGPPEELFAAGSSVSGFVDTIDRAVADYCRSAAEVGLCSEAFAEIRGFPAELRREVQRDEFLETMDVEYLRLFVTAFPSVCASPYESYYREGRVMGRAAQDCLALYREQGLTLSQGGDLADHIVTQLEYVQFLCLLEIQALQEGRESLRRSLCGRKRTFYAEHLMQWVPEFCSRIREHSGVEFYRGMSRLLKDFVIFENRSLQANELDRIEEEGRDEVKRA